MTGLAVVLTLWIALNVAFVVLRLNAKRERQQTAEVLTFTPRMSARLRP